MDDLKFTELSPKKQNIFLYKFSVDFNVSPSDIHLITASNKEILCSAAFLYVQFKTLTSYS